MHGGGILLGSKRFSRTERECQHSSQPGVILCRYINLLDTEHNSAHNFKFGNAICKNGLSKELEAVAFPTTVYSGWRGMLSVAI